MRACWTAFFLVAGAMLGLLIFSGAAPATPTGRLWQCRDQANGCWGRARPAGHFQHFRPGDIIGPSDYEPVHCRGADGQPYPQWVQIFP